MNSRHRRDVTRIISDQSRQAREGRHRQPLDIGSSLDAGDGEVFQSPMDAWRDNQTDFGDNRGHHRVLHG